MLSSTIITSGEVPLRLIFSLGPCLAESLSSHSFRILAASSAAEACFGQTHAWALEFTVLSILCSPCTWTTDARRVSFPLFNYIPFLSPNVIGLIRFWLWAIAWSSTCIKVWLRVVLVFSWTALPICLLLSGLVCMKCSGISWYHTCLRLLIARSSWRC